jgi:protein-S-isoprenylcysteine O-methyltransferase Ste14
MYLGFVLALLGVAVLMGRSTPFAPVLAFFAAAQFWYIPFEEQAMRARFGGAFEAYCARVRRWL